MWYEITYPFPNSDGMEKYFHPTLYWTCDYLSMLVFKLFHVSKRGPMGQVWKICIIAVEGNNRKCKLCLSFLKNIPMRRELFCQKDTAYPWYLRRQNQKQWERNIVWTEKTMEKAYYLIKIPQYFERVYHHLPRYTTSFRAKLKAMRHLFSFFFISNCLYLQCLPNRSTH